MVNSLNSLPIYSSVHIFFAFLIHVLISNLISGKMFPTRGDIHIAPFTDDSLYMEHYSKSNFWYVYRISICTFYEYPQSPDYSHLAFFLARDLTFFVDQASVPFRLGVKIHFTALILQVYVKRLHRSILNSQ